MEKIQGQNQLANDVKRIFDIYRNSLGTVRPHFILTGPSGSGKTHTIKAFCEAYKVNFLEINAAALTKEGTSGNSLSKALTPLLQFQNQLTVCFVDEFDKLFISGNSNSDLAHETTNGVQNEFLKVLESDKASVFGDYGKYISANVGNVLFIFAGAFNGEEDVTIDKLREYGMKTEFLGRVGLVFNAQKLKLESLFAILDKSELLESYLNLFPNLKREDVISTLRTHLTKNYEHNTLGARSIHTLIHQYFIRDGKLEDDIAKKSTFQKEITPMQFGETK